VAEAVLDFPSAILLVVVARLVVEAVVGAPLAKVFGVVLVGVILLVAAPLAGILVATPLAVLQAAVSSTAFF
jgi:hypothetical protein